MVETNLSMMGGFDGSGRFCVHHFPCYLPGFKAIDLKQIRLCNAEQWTGKRGRMKFGEFLLKTRALEDQVRDIADIFHRDRLNDGVSYLFLCDGLWREAKELSFSFKAVEEPGFPLYASLEVGCGDRWCGYLTGATRWGDGRRLCRNSDQAVKRLM